MLRARIIDTALQLQFQQTLYAELEAVAMGKVAKSGRIKKVRSAERVNDFATPGVMNLLCRVVDCGWEVSPVEAG